MSNPTPLIDLSLVIPAFNEELRLHPTLERLHAHLSAGPMSYEILVVDDGSRDKTREVVEAAARRIRTSPSCASGPIGGRAPPSGAACSRPEGGSASCGTPTARCRPMNCLALSRRSRRGQRRSRSGRATPRVPGR